MKSKGIKNLLIDLGGVLINLDRQRCIENFQKLGLRNVEDLLDIHNPNGLLMQQEKGLITPAEFRDGVRKMIGKAISDKQIDAAWNSFLVDIPTQKLDLLLKLREKYVVYLLSNTNQIHWEWTCAHLFPYRTFKVEDYFEKTDEEKHCCIEWVVPNAQKNQMEPVRLTLHAGGRSEVYQPHEGEDFGYVITGNVRIHYAGQNQTVHAGESFYFKAGKKHYLENTGSKDAVIIWVTTPPNF